MIEVCFRRAAQDDLLNVRDNTGNVLQSSEILCLGDFYDFGDLTLPTAERSALINATKCRFCHATFSDEDFAEIYDDSLAFFEDELALFEECLTSGEPVRVWIDKNASEYCGLCWFCKTFGNCDGRLILAQRAPYMFNPFQKEFESVLGWCSGSPDDWLQYVYQKPLSAEEAAFYAREWDIFLKENAPMRILLNQNIVGVNTDFFDAVILSFIPKTPKMQEKIMAQILGKWGLDLAFVAERINHLKWLGKIRTLEHREAPDDYRFPDIITAAE